MHALDRLAPVSGLGGCIVARGVVGSWVGVLGGLSFSCWVAVVAVPLALGGAAVVGLAFGG